MNIKKPAGKGKEKGNGKRKAKKTVEHLPLFFPLFPFSSLFLSLLPPFPSTAGQKKKQSTIARDMPCAGNAN
jgi:hypothetical protein